MERSRYRRQQERQLRTLSHPESRSTNPGGQLHTLSHPELRRTQQGGTGQGGKTKNPLVGVGNNINNGGRPADPENVVSRETRGNK